MLARDQLEGTEERRSCAHCGAPVLSQRDSHERRPTRKGRWAKWLAGVTGVIGLLSTGFAFWDKLLDEATKYFSSPELVIGALDPTNLRRAGARDIRYEFTLRRLDASRPLWSTADVVKLIRDGSRIRIGHFTCGEGSRSANGDLYQVVVAIQNLGLETAAKYRLSVEFGPGTAEQVEAGDFDPGVRILDAPGDAVPLVYLYQHVKPTHLPGCVARDVTRQLAKVEQPGDLIRQTYRELNLTRDVAIFEGTLEPHLFQVFKLIIRVPPTLRAFLIIYSLECPNCRRVYRTVSYGQILEVS